MKTKKIALALACVFSCLLTKAQDKYQFMVIEYSTSRWNTLSVSIDGTEYIQSDADYKGQKKSGYNANPLLNKVKEYQDVGWEVMNFNSFVVAADGFPEYHFAYLRKKK